MTNSYSNLVYLHDLLESIIEHDVTFVITFLQARIEEDWIRKITSVSYTSKEEILPNGKRIDVFYKMKNFRKTICLGFEIKTGNEVDEKQLREELEGLRNVKECDDSYLVLIAPDDPKYDVPYYFVPLSIFKQRISDVMRLMNKFVKEIEETQF